MKELENKTPSVRAKKVINRPMAPNVEKFETFLHSQMSNLVSWGSFKGLPKEQAEDVAQNAVIRFLRHYDPEKTKPKTFLYFCMNLEIYEHKRKLRSKESGGRPTSVPTTHLDPETLTKLSDARGNVNLPTVFDNFSTENTKSLLTKLGQVLTQRELLVFCLKALGYSESSIIKLIPGNLSRTVIYKIWREAKFKVANSLPFFEEELLNFVA